MGSERTTEHSDAPHGLPPVSRVGSLDYRVVPMESAADIEDNFGFCDPVAQTILLDATMEPTRAAGIVLHEHLHAIWEDRGIGYSRRQEENIVKALSAGITALFRDNPDLAIRYLQLLGVLE